MGAETRTLGRIDLRNFRASMRPRHDGRGNLILMRAPNPLNRQLQ